MSLVRRRLRLWAVAWLVCQAASLAAFVPRSCCAAHDHAGQPAEKACHEPPPAEACPMQGEEGAACAMHRPAVVASGTATHAGHDGAAPAAAPLGCAMRGTCDGPPLVTLLAQPGVLQAPAPALAAASVVWVVPHPPEAAASLAVPPDAPPPRS